MSLLNQDIVNLAIRPLGLSVSQNEHKWKYLGREAKRTVYYELQGRNKKSVLGWIAGDRSAESRSRGAGSLETMRSGTGA